MSRSKKQNNNTIKSNNVAKNTKSVTCLPTFQALLKQLPNDRARGDLTKLVMEAERTRHEAVTAWKNHETVSFSSLFKPIGSLKPVPGLNTDRLSKLDYRIQRLQREFGQAADPIEANIHLLTTYSDFGNRARPHQEVERSLAFLATDFNRRLGRILNDIPGISRETRRTTEQAIWHEQQKLYAIMADWRATVERLLRKICQDAVVSKQVIKEAMMILEKHLSSVWDI